MQEIDPETIYSHPSPQEPCAPHREAGYCPPREPPPNVTLYDASAEQGSEPPALITLLVPPGVLHALRAERERIRGDHLCDCSLTLRDVAFALMLDGLDVRADQRAADRAGIQESEARKAVFRDLSQTLAGALFSAVTV